ncbi:hypothetical protein [Xaviernesmea oryzae]|uniref:hypothetical protein n=1 Tax=Xaviernesmea oryzae TaxID=464029 RepID=UPI0011133BE2|nr:hypothetical protein [Xaviernesmea oryzae]
MSETQSQSIEEERLDMPSHAVVMGAILIVASSAVLLRAERQTGLRISAGGVRGGLSLLCPSSGRLTQAQTQVGFGIAYGTRTSWSTPADLSLAGAFGGGASPGRGEPRICKALLEERTSEASCTGMVIEFAITARLSRLTVLLSARTAFNWRDLGI